MADFADGAVETIPLWSLTEDTLVEAGEGGALAVLTRWGEFELDGTPVLVRESLRRMAFGPVRLRNVTTSPGSNGSGEHWPVADLAALRRALDQLSGSVVRSLGLNDGKAPLLSVVPTGFAPGFILRELPPGRPVRLSRFAALRPGDGGLRLESPCTRFRVLLSRPPAVRVACALAEPVSVAEVAAGTGLAETMVAEMVPYLVAAGVALVGDDQGRFAEDQDPDLGRWSYHELLFQVRSRTRLDDRPAEPRRPDAAAPPLVKPVPAGRVFPLHRPDHAETSASLTGLLEAGYECPAFSGHEIPVERIGELLFRSARIRSIGPAHLLAGPGDKASQRPYFNTAGLYELEIYFSANLCPELPKGIYYYDPLGHALVLVNEDRDELGAMLDMAMVAGAGHQRPAALITVTTRMERSHWVLGGAAYAAAMMHFGALQQTLSLVSATMGLAAHAVPVDAGDRVDRALKLSWPGEAAVGECVLDRIP
ncbi:SagB/ThcOx family dehydrogenase [Amycolatopsis nigrescens]|uniref:SagB/ThcOx family dehydrogenase n=1 Tax=Amycolatopsis nigrescens TaxID=381445 RepID=UPI00037E147D|nr:SagB/ThcOx family dehydrogenase [Amycolatopsis nigrescens]